MKIYLSAPFGRREEVAEYAKPLRDLDYEVVSSWLEDSPLNYEPPEVYGPILSVVDVTDVANSDVLICFPQGEDRGYSTGGHHVELGLAYAWDKVVCIVGNPVNVFHWLPEIAVFDSWENCLNWLRLIKEDMEANEVV